MYFCYCLFIYNVFFDIFCQSINTEEKKIYNKESNFKKKQKETFFTNLKIVVEKIIKHKKKNGIIIEIH